MSGWVKIHRGIRDWEWYNDSVMVHLFIHLLLEANHEPKKWQGVQVNRGQLITGRHSLSEKLGVSEQKIKTCLNRLKSTNEITSHSTNRYTIITICNYDKYQIQKDDYSQPDNQPEHQQTTSKQPANNQQTTTTKNIRSKEVKNSRSKEDKKEEVIKEKAEASPLFQPMMDIYWEWAKRLLGVNPKIDGGDGKSINTIISYLSGLEQVKGGLKTETDVFKFILDNFDKWDLFHQKQVKLTQINSNLTNIINSIKNGGPKHRDATRTENAKLGEIIRSGVEIDFRPQKPK